jgi:hypothetical protein
MNVPLELTFRDIEPSEPVKKLIYKRAERLERICDYLSSCRVSVEQETRRRREGNDYHVRIDLTVPPSHELVVSRDPGGADKRGDLRLVIGRAFDAAQKQLKELVQRQRGTVKRHPEQEIEGVVIRLLRDEEYGFLRDLQGRELYFHRNSMDASEWDRVEVGAGVNFFEHLNEGRHGPQASTVRIVEMPRQNRKGGNSK